MTLPPAWDTLQAALARGDDEAAEQAAQHLVQQAEDPAALVDALAPWLQSPDPDRRWWALRILAEVPDPRVPALLHQGLKDPDPQVKQAAALGLRLRPTAQAVDDLVDLLAHPDRLLASLAADALMAVGKAATPALLRVIQEGPPQARAQAVRALAALEDPRAIPTLFSLLDDPSPLISQWAEEGLARLGIGMLFFWP